MWFVPSFISAAVLLSIGHVQATTHGCPPQAIRITTDSGKELFGVGAGFGPLPDNDRLHFASIAVANPVRACERLDVEYRPEEVVVVERGDCMGVLKALNAQNAGAAAVIMYDTVDGELPPCIISNESVPSPVVHIPFVAVSAEAGKELTLTAAIEGKIQIAVVKDHFVFAAVALWILAVGAVSVGALWAGNDLIEGRDRRAEIPQAMNSERTGRRSSRELSQFVITERSAPVFVVVASVMLLVLFFVLNRVVFFLLLGFFGFVSVLSGTIVLGAFFLWLIPSLRHHTMDVICLGQVHVSDLFALPIAVSATVLWAVFRNSQWSWALQDALGLCVVLLPIRYLKIPNLKVGSLLLLLFVMYDVFWVFIQPLITPEKGSVMVEVVTGKGINEYMPMAFRVPSIWDRSAQRYSILGYGDVVFPGILVAYTRRVDIDLNKTLKNGYFLYTCVAYSLGFLVTYVAQYFHVGGSRAQPALLYLVPFTLGTVWVLSWKWKDCLWSHRTRVEPDSSESDEEEVDWADSCSESVSQGRGSCGAISNRAALLDRTSP